MIDKKDDDDDDDDDDESGCGAGPVGSPPARKVRPTTLEGPRRYGFVFCGNLTFAKARLVALS